MARTYSSFSSTNPNVAGSIAIPGQPHAITALPLASRRPSQRCYWTHEEILTLIDCYRDKLYSLHRSKLSVAHWEEVAVAISHRCPVETPKTFLQCRHKVEKLLMRFRSEKQLSLKGVPSAKPSSSWVYFSKMDAIERGRSNSSSKPSPVAAPTELDVEDDVKEYDAIRSYRGTTLMANGGGTLGFEGPKSLGSKLDGPGADRRGAWLWQSPNHRKGYEGFCGTKPPMNVMDNKKRRRKETRGEEHKDFFGVLASAVGMFTDCYLRTEQMKMAMERERGKMWMEMELKKTELLRDYQQSMVESLANVFLGKKKERADSSPCS